MRWAVALIIATSVGLGCVSTSLSAAPERSDNIRVLARFSHRSGPMAFEGDRVLSDSGWGFTISRLSRRAPYLSPETKFVCPTSGGRSISLWRGFVIQSGRQGEDEKNSPHCNDTDPTVAGHGIRIVNVRVPYQPRQVRYLEPSCYRWSPGHALFPLGRVAYIYDVWELPYCDAHDPEPLYMKVIRFDPDHPRRARTVSTPDTGGVEGCDRVTVSVARRLLACSAINRLSLYDLTDPANPRSLGVMTFNSGFLWEASFTWSGDYLVVGQYIGGGDGCDLIIVDVRNPSLPLEAGRLSPPRAAPGSCPNPFSVQVLPTRDQDRYLALVGWSSSGLSVVDFTDPSAPLEHAFYAGHAVRYAYWYNGLIYALTTDDEMLVLKLQGANEDSMRYFRRFYPHTQYESFES